MICDDRIESPPPFYGERNSNVLEKIIRGFFVLTGMLVRGIDQEVEANKKKINGALLDSKIKPTYPIPKPLET